MSFDPSDDSPRKKNAQDAKPSLRKAEAETTPLPADSTTERPGERIAKALARAGLCSRREAERWIEEGRISVNGVVLESPAFNVTAQDRIAVDGRPVDSPEPTRLWRYHKPDGLVTTHKDPQGRETVFDHLPEDLPRVISVGRLDLSSEGLLLLTNDGGLARSLELPSTGWLRRYRVRAFGRVSQEELAKLADGITVDGITYGPMEAILDRAETANAWITVSIREGKNREVRRVLEAIGLKVNRLIRVSYGPFQLGKMPPGSVEEVAPSALKEMLGTLMPDLPPRFSSRPARIPRPVVEAAPVKTGRRGPKPPPKSAKTRVSLLEEETMRREAGKAKSRAAHSGPGAPSVKGKADWAGKPKAGFKKPSEAGPTSKGKPHAAPWRAGDGPKRPQASTKPRKPSR
ncbi:MAG: pseudouridine synthase [Hyphomonadaceae bacterium]